jgi:hypothetical protein
MILLARTDTVRLRYRPKVLALYLYGQTGESAMGRLASPLPPWRTAPYGPRDNKSRDPEE